MYAQRVEGARSLALGPDGVVFVGSRSQGKVYALIDRNSEHRVDEVVVVAKGLNSPNGVAYHNGSLYVAEISRVLRFDDIGKRLLNPPEPATVNDTFPKDTHHGWKFIRFGPDGKLYVPVGAPCNICLRDDPR
jgi:glucose/arabinose dehydrogenase